MDRRVRMRFWVELGLGMVSGLLFLLTLVTREWVELVFGVDPDHGSGALEWVIVTFLALSTLVFGALARRERRRPLLGPSAAADTRT